jgi:hypothetical protein
MKLVLSPTSYAITRLLSTSEIPAWVPRHGFVSVTRTAHELSIVSSGDVVPPDSISERHWRAFQVGTTLDFSLTGVLLSIAEPLARANVTIFVVSTYDTDYVLVKEDNIRRAIDTLAAAGFSITEEDV